MAYQLISWVSAYGQAAIVFYLYSVCLVSSTGQLTAEETDVVAEIKLSDQWQTSTQTVSASHEASVTQPPIGGAVHGPGPISLDSCHWLSPSNRETIVCPAGGVHWTDAKGEHEKMFNSLWPSDAIWRQRSGSILAQVMACCLTAPSHYLNQCWLIISKVLGIHLRTLS